MSLSAAVPHDESTRLAELRRLAILDSDPEPIFDSLTRAAATACRAPVAWLTLVDKDRQWLKSAAGYAGERETPRGASFCAHALLDDDLFEVPDAVRDERFADNPLVTGAPDIRFYAGAPLRLSSGARVGALCVIDRTPRRLTDEQRIALQELATVAVEAFDVRRQALDSRALRDETVVRKAALEAERERMARILEATHAGTWELNIRTGETRYNERWAEIIGYTLAELGPTTARAWVDRIHPDDLPRVEAQLRAHYQGTVEYFNAECRIRHRDGSWVWVQDRGRVSARCEDGRPLWIHGTHTDVTAGKNLEEALRASENFLERVGQIAGVGGWELDLASGRIGWSDHTCRLHDVAVGHRPTLDEAISYFAPGARPTAARAFQRSIVYGTPFELELPMVSATGRPFWARAVASVEFERDHAVRVVGGYEDVTPRKRIECELERSRELLQVTLDSIGDAVITTGIDGIVQWLNPVAERMTGWTKADAPGRPLREVFRCVDETTRATMQDPVAACLRKGENVSAGRAVTLVARDGTEYGIENSASPIRTAGGELHGAVLVFRDVSEQRRLHREMNHRATHDPLTGLVNRGEFESGLSRMLAAGDDAAAALLYIDLDHFKLVNDACGHGAGDHLLRQVSAIFRSCVRGHDVLARVGGDEFGIVLHHCDVPQAERLAQKICDRLDEFRFLHEGRRFRVGASIGLVPIDGRWSTIGALLQAADASCYAAKDGGRNRVHAWFDSDQMLHARRGDMQWVTRLEMALDEDRFELFGQRIEPIDGSASGLYFEVLLRLREPNCALVPPAAFLPAAERFHLATRIDRWVVRQAFDWMQRAAVLGPAVEMVSVNLSGQSLGDRAFHRDVLQLVRRADFDASKLCFEITETAAITHLAEARAFIDEARQLGVRIALDDFGAGASSFGYLKSLPVDFLKIDGHFVTNLLEDALNNAAVRCFCDVAKVVGVRTIAGFVERTEVRAELAALGVHLAQGYLIHRPEPLASLLYAEATVA